MRTSGWWVDGPKWHTHILQDSSDIDTKIDPGVKRGVLKINETLNRLLYCIR